MLVRTLIAVTAVALGLWTVEALWPEQEQPKWRQGSGWDLFYLLLDSLVRRVGSVAVIVVAVALLIAHVARPSIAAQQPQWLQVVEVLVGGDLINYWLHRAFHMNKRLWPFHAVHHSAPMLDWVAAARQHPVDDLVHQVIQVLPFFLLGFQPRILAAYAPFLTIYPILLHANVRWGFGPLRWIIASPAWHRWHHASEPEALDKNFSGLFPWVDLLFGTAYFPNRAPKVFGLADGGEPRGLWAQLTYPWRTLPAAA